MDNIKLTIDNALKFVSKEEINNLKATITEKINALYNKTAKGNDFLGWVKLPSEISIEQIQKIEKIAAKLQKEIEIIVVIGIGGSYLGTKAIAEALSHSFVQLQEKRNFPLIVYAGHNIGEDYLNELLQILDRKRYGMVVISKSGTTTEPAIAFRILKNHLEKKVGKEKAGELIIAVTDGCKGALRTLSKNEGYETFEIPDDVGGRFSVLTPVGLVPLAIGGFNIKQLVQGAKDIQLKTGDLIQFEENQAAIYAATRYLLYKKGKKIEILANFDQRLHYFAEWWKQLYGESEGKEGRGIFPASVDLTTDLHSMGQYIQDGERTLIETVISIKKVNFRLEVPEEKDDLDSLNFLKGKRIDYINKMAEKGTMLAHVDGQVPNILIEIPVLNEYYLGQLMYFFEIACGISGYLLDVNPFNQPGVEDYKQNMFALLEKPGFEEETKIIKQKLK